ncbi:MAG: hypothetical protein ACP5O1_04455 [Phycisphaerae bacterium]
MQPVYGLGRHAPAKREAKMEMRNIESSPGGFLPTVAPLMITCPAEHLHRRSPQVDSHSVEETGLNSTDARRGALSSPSACRFLKRAAYVAGTPQGRIINRGR